MMILNAALCQLQVICAVSVLSLAVKGDVSLNHRCDKRLQRLQKILCKRVYYFVNVYLNKNHMSETKHNYDGKASIAFESVTD